MNNTYYTYKNQDNVFFEGDLETLYIPAEYIYENIFSESFNYKYGYHIDRVKEAFQGKKDKSGFPLELHALRIASALHLLNYDDDYIITAIYHDIFEDSDMTYEEFGYMPNIWTSILQLTRKKEDTYFEYINNITEPIALKVKEMDLNDHLYYKDDINSSLIKRYEKALKIIESKSSNFASNVKGVK